MPDLADYLKGLDAFKARLDELEAENKKLESELAKTQKNRDAILREKRELQGRATTNGDVVLSREDARNPMKYREARDLAEKRGVRVIIVDDNAVVTTMSSRVKYLHDEDAGILHANAELIERVGVQRLQQMASEKNAHLSVFRTVDHLPEHMQAKHARIVDANDPDTLL